MKILPYFLFLVPVIGFTQEISHWQHLDPETDKVPGVSSYRAFEYLKGRQADTVIVAVIDNGADTRHEDLEGVFWVNRQEIENNNTDDDGNGYIDDIYGWNFLGNPDGRFIKHETLELTRLFRYFSNLYEFADTTTFDTLQLKEYQNYRNIRENYESEFNRRKKELALYEELLSGYIISAEILSGHFKKETYTEKELKKIRTKSLELITARDLMLKVISSGIDRKYMENRISGMLLDIETRYNPNLEERVEIVGDDPDDINDTFYGSNMVNVGGPSHGTGVSSVIAALHNNNGIDGIAGISGTIKIMVLRVVPSGDERDKDVALAIRYAVNNGAHIINCSFGKSYTSNPGFVQEAILEAEKAGVLIIHAAGNDSEDNDLITHYPSGIINGERIADNWINVGASTMEENEKLAAYFSNYGKNTVEVFAPGHQLSVASLNNEYSTSSGTSFAAPVVAGVAAVLKAYFPQLTAKELKEIILRSVYIPKTTLVEVPGKGSEQLTGFDELSVSGGIVNLFNAIILAESEYIKD